MNVGSGKKVIKVLFMDDEIHDSEAATVNEAIIALQRSGCDVVATDKMSEAISAFENAYYDVFILDIDMHKIADGFQNRRGTMVADIFKSMDNDSAVIMYSAAGTVEDLYTAANCHVYGYVYKNEENAVDKLVQMVNDAAVSPSRTSVWPRSRKKGAVLMADTGLQRFSVDVLHDMVAQAGDFTMEICPLTEMTERLSEKSYAAGVLLTNKISTRPASIKQLNALFSFQPSPHIIVGYPGNNNRDPILFHLVNVRPFRLIDLLGDCPEKAVSDAIRQAALWYGGNQTFSADMIYVQRAAKEIDWETLRQEITHENVKGDDGALDETAD